MKKDMENTEIIQNPEELVIIGSDVTALYPSLTDIEVAITCFDAVLNSDIKFLNINYQVAGKYVAMHLTPEEQRRSPLYNILPRRTSKNGVRPGVRTGSFLLKRLLSWRKGC